MARITRNILLRSALGTTWVFCCAVSFSALATEAPAAEPSPVESTPGHEEGEDSFSVQLNFEGIDQWKEKGRVQTRKPDFVIGGQTLPGTEIRVGNNIIVANDSGEFQLRVPLVEGEQVIVLEAMYHDQIQTIKIPVEAKLPPEFFAVGLAELETGLFQLDGNLDAIAQNDNFPKALYLDGRIAYYLKGKVLGKYLLTSAFDSARPFQPTATNAIDPNRFYPIYGDSSTLVRDAQASGKLYVKLEHVLPSDPDAPRNLSNLLLGDYNTGFVSETLNLGQYNRTFYGLRGHFAPDTLPKQKPWISASVFAAPVRTIPVRDELRATGLSYYRLSVTQTRLLDQQSRSNPSGAPQLQQPFIVEGTEIVTVVVRDKNQPDRIVQSRQLQRGIDYDLDPFFGSITIKQPVSTFDPNGNMNFVVVNYEYANDPFYGLNPLSLNSFEQLSNYFSSAFSEALSHNAFGGRVESSLFNDTWQLGATAVKEQGAPSNMLLLGTDTLWQPHERVRLLGEYAFSHSVLPNADAGTPAMALMNSLNGFLSTDGGISWNSVSPASTSGPSIGQAFRVELDTQPFDTTGLRLFIRQTDPLFASLFGGGEPGIRRYGGNFDQQLNDFFALQADVIQTDGLPRPDLQVPQLFTSNTIASLGLHWQNTPITPDQVIPNAPGGDISYRQRQSLVAPATQQKTQVTGGEPAIAQESARKMTPPVLSEKSPTQSLPDDRNAPPQEQPLQKPGAMFGDLRAELSRSDNNGTELNSGRLRGSFNIVPWERVMGNARGALGMNQFNSPTQDTKQELAGEFGLGASYALDKYLQLFSRLDFFNIGSSILQPSTTATVGVAGALVENETLSLRPYGQYGLNSAIDARNNVIALGLNNRWKIFPWLTNNLNFEQSLNVNEQFKSSVNQLTHATAGSIGFEILPNEQFKSAVKYELRRQVGSIATAPMINPITGQSTQPTTPGSSLLLDPTLNPQLNPSLIPGQNTPAILNPDDLELWQQTGLLSADGRIGDLSLFALYIFNQFHTPSTLRSRDLHLRTGAAWRPVGNDIFNLVAMHEYRQVANPGLVNAASLEIPLELQADAHVLSLEGIWQIMANVQFSQKYATKFSNSTVLDTSLRNPEERSLDKTITNPTPVTTDLIISRLSYRPFYTFDFWERFDVSGEYRIMRQWPDSIFNAKTGALAEVGYLITPDIRLGAGYNFTFFDDRSVPDNNYQAGNWFLRVTGKY